MKCWICGDDGTTGEHKIKRSDVRSEFGSPTQVSPLYFRNERVKNKPIGSLDAKTLKSPSLICANCNNARTQPHDRAWERMSKSLRTRIPAIAPGHIVCANQIFSHNTTQEMLNVHLYFIKLFGCHIVEGNISIDITAFSNAILNGISHPNIYLKFGCAPAFGDKKLAGMSDMKVAARKNNGAVAFATWFYFVGSLAVNIMFAECGESREGLAGSWHPKFGTSEFTISDF